ncbi:aspartate carbamoyltransferase catalytic subunit [Lacticaseibacillus zhaodongensis]|uniref:aspartate carbamoyltransferase catalytic subunit n=1 Tax=Lacticaseibacillus zhaodongensis TaxID=2668065 RepID=UPI0012D2E87F|nr:aspartate carbamoyltransferase catalytic subunit [Lacticaseibacillus zhaodongensis]
MLAYPDVAKRNILSMQDFSNDDVQEVIKRAEDFKHGAKIELAEPVYVANLFFENSTRTHSSFEMAEHKLGLTLIDFDPQHSSVTKGETLHDTLLTLNSVGVNIAVIRHSQEEYYTPLVKAPDLDIAIVNAGDGAGEHPSQSMLDLMTIHEHFGHFAGLKVLICGDISHSRVARSNAEILQRLGATLEFAGPEQWYDSAFDRYGKHTTIDAAVADADVVMVLRVQHERHDPSESFTASQYRAKYGLTDARAIQMKREAIIMHPGPINRGVELDSDLVANPQCMFAQQMRNGVFVRMALLERVMKVRKLGGLHE